MNFSSTDAVMESIRGAVIVHGSAEDGEGLHLHLQDGRILVVTIIRGCMALALLSAEREALH